MFDNSIINEHYIIKYMETPFRNFKFRGWARNTSSCKFGVIGIDGFEYCTVFSKSYVDHVISDDSNREKNYLENGFYGAVLFYGIDNTSWLVRYKQKQIGYNKIDLSEFDEEKYSKSLFYNS